MPSRYRALRARAVAATLVVSALATLIMGSGGAAAAEPGGGVRPAQPGASQSLLAWGAGYEQVAGSRRVRALQSALRRLKHDPGPIDGLFGPRTEAAVRAFQQSRGLVVDGIVGPATVRALGRQGSTEAAARRAERGRGVRRQAAPPPIAGRRGQPAAAGRAADRSRTPAAPSRTGGRPEAGSGSPLAVVGVALALMGVGALVVTLRRRRRPVPMSGSAPARRARLRELRARSGAIATGPRSPALARSPAADGVGPPAARIDRGGSRPGEPKPRANGHGRTPPEPPAPAVAPLRAVGYLGDLAEAEIGAQAAQMEQLGERRGWTLVELVRAVEPESDAGGPMPPALERALARIGAGEAELLVVTRVEQLGRSVGELAAALDQLKRRGGRLACVEPAIDSTAPTWDGAVEALVGSGAVVGSAPTPERSADAVAPARGAPAAAPPARPQAPASGSPNGGGPSTDRSLKARIVAMLANGMTVEAIAERLNRDGIPTQEGGSWLPASVEAAVGANGRKPQAGAEGQNGRAGSWLRAAQRTAPERS